jgi:hypothetical protein
MGRFSHYDTDEERLPEGMQRIGYDADTEIYTYRDADGSIWEGPPGSRYGHLTRVSSPQVPPAHAGGGEDDDDDPEAPPPYRPVDQASPRAHANGYAPLTTSSAGAEHGQRSWRADLMPFLNFAMLIGLFLLLLFWVFHRQAADAAREACGEGTEAYWVRKGDTCWAIAERHHTTLEALLASNPRVDCDALTPGDTLCTPVG